jgi:hypothetical protein
MKLKNACLIGFAILGIWSCKDDDNPIGEIIPPRLMSEVAVEDDAEIQAFLSTHFYNYEEFQSPPADFDYKIRFDTIAGENADKISILESGMLDGVEFITETISVASSEFGRSDEEVVNHKLYILVARQGSEEGMPTIGDDAILRYEGSLLGGEEFDASTNQPAVFNLSGVVRGFGNGVEYFQTGMGPIENGDGTVSYEGFGIGAIFIPSGLGYFDQNAPGGGIPSYSPIVFKIDAFAYLEDTDFDGDGIPSILEDLNNDGNLNNDNTDRDTEPFNVFLANYNDTDDDGDGIPTIEEIELDAEGNFVGFLDTDGDGIFDHLDNDL